MYDHTLNSTQMCLLINIINECLNTSIYANTIIPIPYCV